MRKATINKTTTLPQRYWLPAGFLALILLLAAAGAGRPGRAAADTQAMIGIDLELYASGFIAPLDLAFDPLEGKGFVAEKEGRIRIIENGQPSPVTFLNIVDRVGSGGAEQGLLGLVFHPDYANNRYFYINYTNKDGHTQISRFTANEANTQADPNSEFPILDVGQPDSTHNGGDLAFGPDGYLYVPLGDGGFANDPQNRAQNGQDLLGKLLRLDVNGGSPYAIPPDNPHVNNPGVLSEVWAMGLRNPWRLSFDRLTGDLFIGDVGQGSWEEVNFQPAASPGGENYGWSCYEGTQPNPNTNMPECPPAGAYDMPVAEYDHGPNNSNCAIIGGFMYRGSQFPTMYGHYYFTDWCSGSLWDMVPDGSGEWLFIRHDHLQRFGNAAFGEDNAGELYIVNIIDGNVYHLVDRPLYVGDVFNYLPGMFKQ